MLEYYNFIDKNIEHMANDLMSNLNNQIRQSLIMVLLNPHIELLEFKNVNLSFSLRKNISFSKYKKYKGKIIFGVPSGPVFS